MIRVRQFSVAGLLFLAACAHGTTADAPPQDYHRDFPVSVQAETVVLPLPVGDPQAPFQASDDRGLALLASSYLDRGHGPLTVTARSPAGTDETRARAWLETVHDRLVAAGVPASSIRLMLSDQGTADAVTVSYQRYTAVVPSCGDWSASARYDHQNQVHSNFGCAQQRNIGLMAADPADLVRMRDVDPTDAQNSSRVMQKFRTGQSPAAVPSPLQSSGAAGTTSSRQ
jgi:pilus assembly protein CpaD